MPVVRKLTEEEVRTVTRGKSSERQRIADEYDQIVMEFEPGDIAEVTLGEGESKPTVRGRINAAFQRRGLELTKDYEWLRGKHDTLRFRLLGEPTEAVDGEVEEEVAQELPELEEYEVNGNQAEPVVAAPVATPAAKRPARNKQVTDRKPFVEAP